MDSTSQLKRGARDLEGMSLIEVILSLFMLTLLSLFLIATLTQTKYMAEDNLYESTSLAVVLSTMQQMMASSSEAIDSNTFTMRIGDEEAKDLTWSETLTLDVPVVTEEGGATGKTMELKLTPSRTAATNTDGWWIEIEYSYDHPGTGKTRTSVIRNMRSTVDDV